MINFFLGLYIGGFIVTLYVKRNWATAAVWPWAMIRDWLLDTPS